MQAIKPQPCQPLKQEGYTSSFFHGGQNGTMGLTIMPKSAGLTDTMAGPNMAMMQT